MPASGSLADQRMSAPSHLLAAGFEPDHTQCVTLSADAGQRSATGTAPVMWHVATSPCTRLGEAPVSPHEMRCLSELL